MNKNLYILIAFLIILLSYFTALTQNNNHKLDYSKIGSQYTAYPINDFNAPKLTPTPKGYKLFHMEHYGRHGSRWLLTKDDYHRPVEILSQLQKKNALTPDGSKLLLELIRIDSLAENRYGELTPLGHRQHREIAKRMIKNFPELFQKSNYINANSTTVIRCILSMANELTTISENVSGMNIRMDASYVTQKMLHFTHVDSVAEKLSIEGIKLSRDYYKQYPKNISTFISKIFLNPQLLPDSMVIEKVFKSIFEIAANSQSHEDMYNLYDYFTEDELKREWEEQNTEWYLRCGNSDISNGRIPYAQRLLLANIIESSDTTLYSTYEGINLRFGHESAFLPLLELMEVENTAFNTNDISDIFNHWKAVDYFPMACNLQLLFYRSCSGSGDILVKLLVNEKEVRLPIKTKQFPYYNWSKLRAYYMEKLKYFKTKYKE